MPHSRPSRRSQRGRSASALLAAAWLLVGAVSPQDARPAWDLPDRPEEARRIVGLWDDGARADAWAALEEALADRPRDAAHAPAWFALASWRARFGRPRSALEVLESMDDRARGALDATELGRLRGNVLCVLDRYAEALDHLPAVRATDLEQRIDALLALGRLEEAERELAALGRLVPEDDPGFGRRDGQRLLRRGDPSGAKRRFEAALAADDTDPAALFGLGRSLIALGEREAGLEVLARHREILPLRDALDFALRGLDLAPDHAPNLVAVAEALAGLGRLEQAAGRFDRALALAGPDELAPIALRAARFAEERRADPDGALAVLAAARERSDDVRLLVRAGDVCLRAARPDDALAHFLAAAERRPDDPQIQERVTAAREAPR